MCTLRQSRSYKICIILGKKKEQLQCKFSIIHRYERFSFSARLVTVKCGPIRGNLSILLRINLHLFTISMFFIFQHGNLIWTG